MKRFDDTNITRALVIMLILTLVAISVFYIINNTGTAAQIHDLVVIDSTFAGISTTNPAPQRHPEGSFISSKDAHKVAKSRFELTLNDGIPVGYYWEDGKVGTPILVKNMYEQPAYWKVPVEYENRIIGYVDVRGGGNVPRFGGYYQNPVNLENSILRVPEMTPDYVKNMAKNVTANYSNYKIDEPILTYEDTEGHDAWMINVRNSEGVVSRIYVTPKHVSETVLQEFNEETTSWQDVESDEGSIGGIYIEFEYETTEHEVRSILENYDLINDYKLKYNVNSDVPNYYISVDNDDVSRVEQILPEDKYFLHVIPKGNHSIITIKEHGDNVPVAYDPAALIMLSAHNIQLKKITPCYVRYDGPEYWIDDYNATRIITELEDHRKIIDISKSPIIG